MKNRTDKFPVIVFLILSIITGSYVLSSKLNADNTSIEAIVNKKEPAIDNKENASDKKSITLYIDTNKTTKKSDTTAFIEFPPLPEPQIGDWLSQHHEPGQTLKEFLQSEHNIPGKKRNKIYIQPIEKFDTKGGPSLETLKDFTQRYFCMPVVLLSVSRVDTNTFTSRINQLTRNKQYQAMDILNFLLNNLPSDAFCILAITMTDLYPEPSWNFVFGYASFRQRVGVFSFARYYPDFYGVSMGSKGDNDIKFLLRCCKILGHETGHMYGMMHCISYHCCMNGSNHLREFDAQPIHLCPICLQKLQRSVGFNIVTRYKGLLEFYSKAGFKVESDWVQRRIDKLEH